MTTDLRAKKSLGQNWLVNEGVLDRIVETAEVSTGDTVLEIGPGKGALTRRLAATGARVVAVEKDRRLIEPLRAMFADAPNVTIKEADIMNFAPTSFGLDAMGYKLVANIPYYLTSRLIRLTLESWRPSLAVLMVQDEVARRIMATPPDMNLLALSVRLYALPSVIMKVSRGSFRPIPDVDSAVVKLTLAETHPDSAAILSLAKKAFMQKRKQLKSAIPAELLTKAGISPSARPQELSVDDWHKIASASH
jgi:16S rRNA (adenine1518-N6/adenine1519-N6)-dimethyltransferase